MMMEQLVPRWTKGMPALDEPTPLGDIPALQPKLLDGEFSLPAAVLYEKRLQHNLDWMRRFTAAYDVRLAPHGKTTMAPRLFHRQIESGAWGITLATVPQVIAAYEQGVRRILMANQLVGETEMTLLLPMLRDPLFEFYCLVDHEYNASELARFFLNFGMQLNVLLEVGWVGGRSGIRSEARLNGVLEVIARNRSSLRLCGMALYEGICKDEPDVRAFLTHGLEIATQLASRGLIDRSPAILSGAGSQWFDLVAEAFGKADIGMPTEVLLRPGCYLTHDVGLYVAPQRRILAENPVAREMNASLLPALQVWAYVTSIPEPNLAIIGMGKRDVSFDSGLPVPAVYQRPLCDEWLRPRPVPDHWQLTRIMDQHAFLEIRKGDNVRIGDMIAFDVIHPCLTFDKWKYLSILDQDFNLIEVVETFF